MCFVGFDGVACLDSSVLRITPVLGCSIFSCGIFLRNATGDGKSGNYFDFVICLIICITNQNLILDLFSIMKCL